MKKKERKDYEQEIEDLRRRVEQLEEKARQPVEYHFHYHYDWYRWGNPIIPTWYHPTGTYTGYPLGSAQYKITGYTGLHSIMEDDSA